MSINKTGTDLILEQRLVNSGWVEKSDDNWHLAGETRAIVPRDQAVLIQWNADLAEAEANAMRLRLSRQQNITILVALRVLAVTTVLFAGLWIRSLL